MSSEAALAPVDVANTTPREIPRELTSGMLNSRAGAGKKTVEERRAMSDADLAYELEGMPVTDSCDVVRRKIRAFLDNGEMKVGEFQKAISVNSVGYSRFMSQNGPWNGAGSNVYGNAWLFFKMRELRGIKTPHRSTKPKKGEEGAAAGAQAGSVLAAVELPSNCWARVMTKLKSTVTRHPAQSRNEPRLKMTDTCDEIRRTINAHLKKPGVTQAQFLRDIAASYKKEPRKIQSTQLSSFRSKKGAYNGNTNAVFYGAYVYFEKKRIAEKKPKSTMRLEMEEIWGKDGGMDTKTRQDRFTVMRGDVPYMDKYGRVDFY